MSFFEIAWATILFLFGVCVGFGWGWTVRHNRSVAVVSEMYGIVRSLTVDNIGLREKVRSLGGDPNADLPDMDGAKCPKDAPCMEDLS